MVFDIVGYWSDCVWFCGFCHLCMTCTWHWSLMLGSSLASCPCSNFLQIFEAAQVRSLLTIRSGQERSWGVEGWRTEQATCHSYLNWLVTSCCLHQTPAQCHLNSLGALGNVQQPTTHWYLTRFRCHSCEFQLIVSFRWHLDIRMYKLYVLQGSLLLHAQNAIYHKVISIS